MFRTLRCLRRFSTQAVRLAESPELNIASSAETLSVNVQIPTTERLDAFGQKKEGIPGLLSDRVFEDVWTKQAAVKLDDLKYGISESPARADLESCFENAASAPAEQVNPFAPGGGRRETFAVQEFSLTTSNIVADRYYGLLKKTAKQPTEHFVFQSASSIYNLFYFVSSLKESTNKVAVAKDSLREMPDIFAPISNEPQGEIAAQIIKSFGSVQEFRTLLLASANSIHGNGYTWLVHRFVKPQRGQQTKDMSRFSSLVVLNTYNNGTPHQFRSGQISTARKYNEKRAALENSESAEEMLGMNELDIPTMAEAQDSYEMFEYTHEPLLAVGVNPSFYLRDYGVYGKKKYLENVWDCIDWSVVGGRMS